MRTQQDRDAALLETHDQVADFGRALRIDAGSRFVQHQQAGFLDQGLREADALQHALRVSPQAPVAGVFQPHEFEQFVRPGPAKQIPDSPQSFP